MAVPTVTILVVDDEEPIRELLVAILEGAGYRCLVAGNGFRALEIVRGERPTLVLTDLLMPLLTGQELCQRLKADPVTRSIPVIIISAAEPAAAEGSGADAFLQKPFYLQEVEAVVEHWLTRNQVA